ncbi:MAG TPA: hypothetical protein VGR00_03915, partial [Thermoanaerobaculia bacterium]|nr:hypothetical protein [Thermoanaerobaculia bacterium]
MTRDKRNRVLLLLAVPVLLTAAAVSVAKGGAPPAKRKPRPTPQAGGNLGVVKPSWKEVDRLVDEQKLEEASKVVEKLRTNARAAGDEAEWTKALIREVQLRTALHGYETSVRFLMDQPWPKGARARATLNLFYGQSLVTYENAYGWEIAKREKVESKEKVDLKAWTKDEIHAQAVKAYVAVWNERDALGHEPVSALSEYLDANSYPKGIRDTLRDAVSYLFVELLANTSAWRPEQSNEIYALDLPSLIAGDPKVSALVELDDPAVHPLVKIAAVLDDLEAWHAREGEREASLEARLARLRRLHASFTEAEDRKEIRKALEKRLPAFHDVPWWAAGMADLAGFVREEDDPNALVRARRLAEQGWKAYPKTVGGERCLYVVKSIEA